MNSDNNPTREPGFKRRKIEPEIRNNNSPQQATSNPGSNDQVIEILSDEETAPPLQSTNTVVHLDTELEDSSLSDIDYRDDDNNGDANNDVQIVSVNTANPTPLSTPLSNLNHSGVPTNTNTNNNNNNNNRNGEDRDEDDDDLQILGVRNIYDPNNGRLLTPVGDIPFVREDDDYTIVEDAPRRNLNPAIARAIRRILDMERRYPLPSQEQIRQILMENRPWMQVSQSEFHDRGVSFDNSAGGGGGEEGGGGGGESRPRPQNYHEALQESARRALAELAAMREAAERAERENSSRQGENSFGFGTPRRSYVELTENETSQPVAVPLPRQRSVHFTEEALRRGNGGPTFSESRDGSIIRRERRQPVRYTDSPQFLHNLPFLGAVVHRVPHELRFLGNTFHDVGFALDNLMDDSDTPRGFNSAIERSIMQRIEDDTNRMIDRRIAQETNYNKKTKNEIEKKIANQDERHTSNIKSNENLVCELCNIVLGEGAPDDFKGDIRYNEKFSKYCETYNCQAPWFCVYPFTEVDIELSKRIFVAKCGHLFCGRCVKNIGNRPKLRKSKTSNANSSTAEISILNPKFYAPSTCPELQCQKKFLSKSFTEVYF